MTYMADTPTLRIAKTIQSQIVAQSPTSLMSYGAKDFVALTETDKRHGGFQFRTNGLKHKGLVLINLMFNDTYTVETVKIRKGEVKVCDSYDDVYADQLIEVLDHMIEGRQYVR